ncbi:MAG: hypothetical protein RLN70_02165, partial [Rhodospirillaceae bacterium]
MLSLRRFECSAESGGGDAKSLQYQAGRPNVYDPLQMVRTGCKRMNRRFFLASFVTGAAVLG